MSIDDRRIGRALLKGVENGDREVWRSALRAGADPNYQDLFSGYRPLHAAARRGDLEAGACLLDAGASLEAHLNTISETPLEMAIANGHLAFVKLVISHVISDASKLGRTWEQLIEFAQQEGSEEIVAVLRQAARDSTA